jgi:hypothetical protein
MKGEKIVCDVCGKTIVSKHSILLLRFHPPKGFAQTVTVDLCDEHAKPTWESVKQSVGK